MTREKSKTTASDITQRLERLTKLTRSTEYAGDLNPAQWEALRYLHRANRFSNAPIALAKYLSATKGTISQTLKALERKGYVIKSPRADEKRSLALSLTAKAQAALTQDPLLHVEKLLEQLSDKTRRRLDKGLAELLDIALEEGQQLSFGTCMKCRYFRENRSDDSPTGPHHCMYFKADLTVAETQQICIASEPRG